MLGSASLLLSGGVDVLGFLETLSGVSVNKLYNNGDGDGVGDVKEDDNVMVYGVVPDMHSKLCNSMQSLFSCLVHPTTNTFDPNLLSLFDRKDFFC